LPAISTAGFRGDCKLIKHGFFPAGGGKITFAIRPWQKDTHQVIDLCEPSRKLQIHARIYTAKLPVHIARRQQKLLLQSGLNIQNIEHIEVTDSDGPGNCVMIRLCNGGRTTVFTAFGMRGKPSQQVVDEVVKMARDFLASGAAVDRFLADQLLIYMALNRHFAKRSKMGTRSKTGCYTTNELSTHLSTNMEIIRKFLPVNFNLDQQKKLYKISCQSE